MERSEQSKDILKWRLTLAETLAFGVTIASLTFWISDRFQSKEDGHKLEQRIENVERDISNLRTGMNQIAVDVSYIRAKVDSINTKK